MGCEQINAMLTIQAKVTAAAALLACLVSLQIRQRRAAIVQERAVHQGWISKMYTVADHRNGLQH